MTYEQQIERFSDWLKIHLKKKPYKLNYLARKTEVPIREIKGLLAGKSLPNKEHIRYIMWAFGYTPLEIEQIEEELFND